jgi:UDP-glucuronate 4-epimerase
MKILITGCAGFIGYHLTKKLLEYHNEIIGIDCLTEYYDIGLKKARLERIENQNFVFYNLNISEKDKTLELFNKIKPDYVINLAAQAGVRFSIENPYEYLSSNMLGFLNILEACKINQVKTLFYASSSSVYGSNNKFPFKETDEVTKPLSFYASTKISNEVMAHSYSNIFKLNTVGLRFFTVYGPWGRPDMAYYIFTKKIIEGIPIQVFGNGKMLRDFTYIDDIVDGIISLISYYDKLNLMNLSDCNLNEVPSSLFNIGNNKPIELSYFIKIIENYIGKKAIKEFVDIQPGDVFGTAADIQKLKKITNFSPRTNIENGIKKFIDWYNCFHKCS